MHTTELLVQSQHLLGVRRRVVAPLTITGFYKGLEHEHRRAMQQFQKEFINGKLTLVLPLAHHIDGDRTQNEHVHQPGHGHGCHGQEGVEAVFWSSQAREPQCLSATRRGQGDHHRQSCL